MGFFDLPYDPEVVTEIKKLARQLKEWCRDVLVLGVGGAAAGIRALQQALCHPSHNLFPVGRRQYHSRLFVFDNIDPDSFYGLLDDLELKRLLVRRHLQIRRDPCHAGQVSFCVQPAAGPAG